MPKAKTNSAARKRFKITARGKVKRRQAFKSHILTKKHPDRKRRLRKAAIAAPGDARRIKRLFLV